MAPHIAGSADKNVAQEGQNIFRMFFVVRSSPESYGIIPPTNANLRRSESKELDKCSRRSHKNEIKRFLPHYPSWKNGFDHKIIKQHCHMLTNKSLITISLFDHLVGNFEQIRLQKKHSRSYRPDLLQMKSRFAHFDKSWWRKILFQKI